MFKEDDFCEKDHGILSGRHLIALCTPAHLLGKDPPQEEEWGIHHAGDEGLAVSVRGRDLSVRSIKSALLDALDLIEDTPATLRREEGR